MFQNAIQSFSLAFQNVRSNFFHTLLSVLGIVIGVAALVATFSLIDGLEKFARDTISKSTSLNSVIVRPITEKTINNLPVRKDSFQIIDYPCFVRMKATLPNVVAANMSSNFNREIRVAGRDSSIGAVVKFVAETPWGDTILTSGKLFSPAAFSGKLPEAIVNPLFAKLLTGTDDPAAAIGQSVEAFGQSLTIVGVAKSADKSAPPAIVAPISLLSGADLLKSPPTIFFETAKTEDVPLIKEKANEFLKQEFGAKSTDFQVLSRDFWVDKTKQGFLIFRIVMGLVIGISVIVGGVGVMNVLLISVNERTAEIGLRKAVGARRRDIRSLFLAESITVSAFGSMVGLLLGIGFAKIVIPIIRIFADVPFSAVLTWNTFFVISIVAVLIGVLFGTYPAIKAARLDPVEALRRD